jgi:protein-ribulosamine 3-kinase
MKAALREQLGIAAASPVAGGCIRDCYRATIQGKPCFVKVNAEAEGLAALRTAGLRAPQPLAQGSAAGQSYLLLEYLELRSKGDFAELGRMLANAHRKPGPRFGWARDNYIGSTLQLNGWSEDWAEFWRERRIRPQAERAGVQVDLDAVDRLLGNHRPQPSLLHGDLWSGNAGFTREGPVVFDPAVYYGDREADLAMTELFGGFPSEFYQAYNQTWALDEGYARRKHLYNLYHLLNHLNLFGSGYLGQVERTLRLLRERL